ncbi:hypothetical protein ACSAZL_04275 [Methanosarcina sp. T3]
MTAFAAISTSVSGKKTQSRFSFSKYISGKFYKIRLKKEVSFQHREY